MQAILIAIVSAKVISSFHSNMLLTDQKMKLKVFFKTILDVKIITNLGFGLFFTFFFPYFLHLNPSSRSSTSDFVVLNATLSFTGCLSLLLLLSASHTTTKRLLQHHKEATLHNNTRAKFEKKKN